MLVLTAQVVNDPSAQLIRGSGSVCEFMPCTVAQKKYLRDRVQRWAPNLVASISIYGYAPGCARVTTGRSSGEPFAGRVL